LLKTSYRIYHKILLFSEKKLSAIILFLNTFLRGFFFFAVPTDMLFFPLCLGNPKKGILVFTPVTIFSSVLGGIAGYLLGYFFSDKVKDLLISFHFLDESNWKTLLFYYNKYGIWAIATSVFTPLPFLLYTYSAGIFQFSLPLFILVLLISRTFRYYLFSILFYYYGERIKNTIEKYFKRTFYLFMGFVIVFIIYKIIGAV